MERIPGIRKLLRLPTTEGRVGSDVEEEIAFHVEERTRELMEGGMGPAGARAEALREFGDVREARAELMEIDRRRVRQTRRSTWWSDAVHDIRFGIRSALRAPVFSLFAVLTLALGIGANAGVFGVLKSVLLDTLPYGDAERLVRVYGHFITGADERGPLSAGMVSDIAERQRSFESVAYFQTYVPEAVVGGDDGPRIGRVAFVGEEFFRTLGVPAAQGRTFGLEDVADDMSPVVVLTHAAWQRLFAGDPGVLGRDVRVDGIPREVIGVLPRDFVAPMGEADLFFALDLRSTLDDPVRVRRRHWLGMIGRLNPAVAHEAAQRELAAIGGDLALEYPEDNGSIRLVGMPLREAMVGDTRTPLLVLMASAALVLLIACANLASALLSRAVSRRKEFAVRVALGAGRGRLVRQLLTESTLLALVGGTVGLLLAGAGLATLRGVASPALPSYADPSLDGGAVLVTALLALCTAVLFGVAPALSVGRSDSQGTLREETRGTSESRRSRRLRGALVAGQIALSLSLLVGAGLLARSLWTMMVAPLGFDPEQVLAVGVQLPSQDYDTWEARLQFHEQFEQRLRSLPGALSIASASELPSQVASWNGVVVDGAPPPPNEAQPRVLYASVSDDFFRTVRIPLLRGRTFDARDHIEAPLTVVISESMARRFWAAGDALGARIRIGPDTNAPTLEVVGIVGDVRNDRARPDAEPITYVSMRQNPWDPQTFLIRTDGDPLALLTPAERELAALDPGLPLKEATTLRAILGEGLAGRRLPVVLMGAFGVLALLLVSMGVYAMFANMAAAREREFGVRMALGSHPRAIAALVLRQGALWMATGLAGGVLGVLLVTRLVRELLYGVSPFDPITLGIALVILLVCAMVALLVPVRRAVRVDPAAAMRAQ